MLRRMAKPIRERVAEALRAWMKARPDLDTQVKVSEKTGIGQSSISRILRARTGTNIDNLDAIAQAFGRDPVEMLSPGMSVALQKVGALPEAEQSKIVAFIEFTLAQQSTLSFNEEHPAQPAMQQAMRRAAGRSPTASRQRNHGKKDAGNTNPRRARKLGGNQ